MSPIFRRLPLFVLALALAACHASDHVDSSAAQSSHITAEPAAAATTPARIRREAKVTTLVDGLNHPWALAMLPDGGFLVTERIGALRRVSADGQLSPPLSGVPEVFAQGQGGLLDIVLAPDFRISQRIYFSFAEPGEGGVAGTAVASALLGDSELTDVKVIYRQEPKVDAVNHFGSRLAFDQQGHLFVSQGERTLRMAAQALDKLQGKIVRLNPDGSIPRDNPFVGQKDARPEIWSLGHRNSQGLAVDPRTDTLWESEHGPRGGDEINLPQAGKNYGWPLATHGIDYSGRPITEAVGKEYPGTEPPHYVFEVSPALSGMAFYTGHPGSPWNDSLFLGALAQRNLIRLQLQGNAIVSEERLLGELGERIRDVRCGFDGNVYVITDADHGKLIRVEPPEW